MQVHDDGILEIGNEYTVGTNDGREIALIKFTGYKLLNGKPMMVFRTVHNKKVSINPSYYTFILETEKEIEPVYVDNDY